MTHHIKVLNMLYITTTRSCNLQRNLYDMLHHDNVLYNLLYIAGRDNNTNINLNEYICHITHDSDIPQVINVCVCVCVCVRACVRVCVCKES